MVMLCLKTTLSSGLRRRGWFLRALPPAFLCVLALIVSLGNNNATSLLAPETAYADNGSGVDAAATSPDQEAQAKTKIAINLKKTLGKIPGNAFGVSVGNSGHDRAEPMYFYRTPEGKNKFRELGARALYYGVDYDNWAASFNPFTAVPRLFPDWMDSTEYIALNNDLGTQPIIAVNITILCQQTNPLLPPAVQNVTCQLSTEKQAVDWIKYLKSIGAPIKNVVLGVEPYAGCLYWVKGINCKDSGGRHRVALSQEEYAARVKIWAQALKAANPAVKIGVHLQPNTFLCKGAKTLDQSGENSADDTSGDDISSERATARCGGKTWDEVVLKEAGKYIDFVAVHQYFVTKTPALTEANAQKYSYYQEQINMRVSKNGVTAFPSQIRKELLQWLPGKKNIPIVIAEFNASYLDKKTEEEMYGVRQSLYTGMAVGELYLDLLQPVETPQGRLNGASQAVLLGMFTPQLGLTRMENLLDPTSIVYTPGWHVFSMLKSLQGTKMVSVNVTKNPQTAVKRPALSVYAVTKGKTVSVVVFNHHTSAVTSDIILGAKPLTAVATQLGNTASGFLKMNTFSDPNAITPQTSQVSASQLAKNKIAGYSFPAHSLTVLQITRQ